MHGSSWWQRGGTARVWVGLGATGVTVGLLFVGLGASSAATTAGQKVRNVQYVTMFVKSDDEHAKKGPDGKWHDAFTPASIKVKAGETVVVHVMNFDDGPHSFNATGLGINTILMGGAANAPRETTFTFTADKPGVYAWHCDPKCDPWAMKHEGYMKGTITVA